MASTACAGWITKLNFAAQGKLFFSKQYHANMSDVPRSRQGWISECLVLHSLVFGFIIHHVVSIVLKQSDMDPWRTDCQIDHHHVFLSFPPLPSAAVMMSLWHPWVEGEEEVAEPGTTEKWSEMLFLRLVDGKLRHMTAVGQRLWAPMSLREASDLKTTFPNPSKFNLNHSEEKKFYSQNNNDTGYFLF